jgi:UDPglucose--hexose-1-phosphate uridylyltransferase
VVPNKYPAMLPHTAGLSADCSPYRLIPARGLHEVIVETPEHDRRLVDFDPSELASVLDVYLSRLQVVSRAPGVRSVALFRNEGAAAGASQQHAHAQLVALPIVPRRLAAELAGACDYFRRRLGCVTCHAVEHESPDGHRLIAHNADFVAIASFAPRFPYETWIVPRRHQHDFRSAEAGQVRSLGSLLKTVLHALEGVLTPFPFNLVLQTAPVRSRQPVSRAFHWRLEIVPRLTTASGFELGSGVFIVAVSPEEAARRLRAALAGGVAAAFE